LPAATENLFSHAALMNALDLRLRHVEIVATGNRADELARAALQFSFLERTVLRASNADALPARHPARAKIASAPPEGAAFICVGENCSLPVTNADAIKPAIDAMRPQPSMH
jgi:uncharacterized protein YyaL (SSP411 family)